MWNNSISLHLVILLIKDSKKSKQRLNWGIFSNLSETYEEESRIFWKSVREKTLGSLTIRKRISIQASFEWIIM